LVNARGSTWHGSGHRGLFKKLVTDRFASDLSTEERRERTANVFFGQPEPEGLAPAPPPDEWEKGADNIEAFLAHYAQHFLEADVYNSLKHGLAVRPGDALLKLGDAEELKAEGPSIEYLSIRRDQSGNARWNRSTKWIKPDRDIARIHIATRLMESLWSMAAYRYTGKAPGRVRAGRNLGEPRLALHGQPGLRNDVMRDATTTRRPGCTRTKRLRPPVLAAIQRLHG
jgi:hypothetical protein